MRADEQFKKAADYTSKLGIILKGDIPILMNEDSCDVWAYPNFFDLTMRAGAPPDMYNAAGQNWGFPVYNWEVLKEVDFWWWKERLAQASRYYKAYRLDHILGFFRIFKMSERDFTAYLGRPDPLVPITYRELVSLGFSPDRIRWISEPHVPTQACVAANGGDYLGTHGVLNSVMDRIGDEELWRFRSGIIGERDILALDVPQGIKDVLLLYWHNRVLFKIAAVKNIDHFAPVWTHKQSTAWGTLTAEEKTALEALFAKKDKQNEKLWEERARGILSAITASTPMIACAEDLGVELKAVPKVLSELSILSLCVIRWSRMWNKENAPYVPLKKYPALSVTTTSVHDSSTNRLWWETEHEAEDFVAQNKAPKEAAADLATGVYSVKTAKWFLETAANSASVFCIHPIQDFLAITESYRAADAASERINVPGTVNDFNWTYRLPVTVEKLLSDKTLTAAIAHIAKKHG
jgi:4-alpha-glucanotransferase